MKNAPAPREQRAWTTSPLSLKAEPEFCGCRLRPAGGSAPLPHLERRPLASSRGLGPGSASWRQRPSVTCRCLALTGDLGLAPSPRFMKQALANPDATSAAAVRPSSACSVDCGPPARSSCHCRTRGDQPSRLPGTLQEETSLPGPQSLCSPPTQGHCPADTHSPSWRGWGSRTPRGIWLLLYWCCPLCGKDKSAWRTKQGRPGPAIPYGDNRFGQRSRASLAQKSRTGEFSLLQPKSCSFTYQTLTEHLLCTLL